MLWQNTQEENADASFAPTSAIPGVVFVGSLLDGILRAHDAVTGKKLASIRVGFSLASAPAIVDGIVIVGAGIGERTGDPADQGEITSRIPQNVTALWVPGTASAPWQNRSQPKKNQTDPKHKTSDISRPTHSRRLQGSSNW